MKIQGKILYFSIHSSDLIRTNCLALRVVSEIKRIHRLFLPYCLSLFSSWFFNLFPLSTLDWIFDHADKCVHSFVCGIFSTDHRRTVHMSGESVVAITSRDGRVRFIDMQSAQERPTVLIGHAASVHCILVQEDKKRVFTVLIFDQFNLLFGIISWKSFRVVMIWQSVVGIWKMDVVWNCTMAMNVQWRVWQFLLI